MQARRRGRHCFVNELLVFLLTVRFQLVPPAADGSVVCVQSYTTLFV